MLGQRIKHPKATNFEEDFSTPPAKRIKREESVDSLCNVGTDDQNDHTRCSPNKIKKEIPDSEADDYDDNEDALLPPASQTELESALPPIKTDKEAISAYEAARAAGDVQALDLQGRVGQRKWIQGKSSIYVDAFNLALETVLEDESDLFDEAEKEVFECWRRLSYEAQYLWVVHEGMSIDGKADHY